MFPTGDLFGPANRSACTARSNGDPQLRIDSAQSRSVDRTEAIHLAATARSPWGVSCRAVSDSRLSLGLMSDINVAPRVVAVDSFIESFHVVAALDSTLRA